MCSYDMVYESLQNVYSTDVLIMYRVRLVIFKLYNVIYNTKCVYTNMMYVLIRAMMHGGHCMNHKTLRGLSWSTPSIHLLLFVLVGILRRNLSLYFHPITGKCHALPSHKLFSSLLIFVGE